MSFTNKTDGGKWEVTSATVGSPQLAALLAAGWVPFGVLAGVSPQVYLKRPTSN